MAKISICAINKLAQSSIEQKMIDEYLKRIPWKIKINQLESKKNSSPDKQKEVEGNLLLDSTVKDSIIIALDENGENLSSVELTKFLEKNIFSHVNFLIGGASGLSEKVKEKSNLLLSFGRITMPHMLARIILVEQIYRCYTIMSKHPYHK